LQWRTNDRRLIDLDFLSEKPIFTNLNSFLICSSFFLDKKEAKNQGLQ